MPQQQIDWQSRPRSLREFPEDTQVRLRLLEFNRSIAVCAQGAMLYTSSELHSTNSRGGWRGECIQTDAGFYLAGSCTMDMEASTTVRRLRGSYP